MKAGAWTATDQSVELQVQEIAQNAPMLLEIINEMNLETARDLSVPSPLLGYENKQNYSNLVQTLISWKESDLDAERRWLSDLIEAQLLNEIFKQELDEQGVQIPDSKNVYGGENLVTQQLTQVPNEQPLNPYQPQGLLMPQTQIIPPAKLTIDITDPNFEPFKEKLESTLMLYDKNLVSARKVLEIVDMEDQIEETEMRLNEAKIKQDEMMNMQKDIFQTQVLQTDQVQNKRMELLGKLEGELGKLEIGKQDGNGNGNAKPKNPFPFNKKSY
jgi:hypothetical protein